MSTHEASRIIIFSGDQIIDGCRWTPACLVIRVFPEDKTFRVLKNKYGPEHDGPHDLSTLGLFIEEWEEENNRLVDNPKILSELADVVFKQLVANGMSPARAASNILRQITGDRSLLKDILYPSTK